MKRRGRDSNTIEFLRENINFENQWRTVGGARGMALSFRIANRSNTSHSSGGPLECDFRRSGQKPIFGAFGRFVVAPDAANRLRLVIYKYGKQTNNPCGIGSSLQSH